jgi:hypothetical protein
MAYAYIFHWLTLINGIKLQPIVQTVPQLPSPLGCFGQRQRAQKKNLTPNFVGGIAGLAMAITRVVQKVKDH